MIICTPPEDELEKNGVKKFSSTPQAAFSTIFSRLSLQQNKRTSLFNKQISGEDGWKG